jgi:hypothetical protein
MIGLIRRVLSRLRMIEAPDLVTAVVSQHPTPKDLTPGRLFLVQSEGLEKWACFRCPGGCGQKIMLSLVGRREPSWVVRTDWLKRPTIQPSVRQINRCGCHFWVTRGCVDWCGDSATRSPLQD